MLVWLSDERKENVGHGLEMPHLLDVVALAVCFFPADGAVEHGGDLPRKRLVAQRHAHEMSLATWADLGGISPVQQCEIVEEVQVALFGGEDDLVFLC